MYETDSAVVAATTSNEAVAAVFGALAVFWLLMLVVGVVMIVAMWKIFVKAGKPGWAAIIPIYNTIVLLEIVERPLWWVILMLFVPIANLVVMIIVLLDLAKKFGKSPVFAIFGLILFPVVGWPMLGFGKSTYQGASQAPVEPVVPTEAPTV